MVKHCRMDGAVLFMKEKPPSKEAKMRGKSADSGRLNKISCINGWAQYCTCALLAWAGRTCCKSSAKVSVAAAAPMGSKSEKTRVEVLQGMREEQPRGEQTLPV